VWLSITGYGTEGESARRVAFGDDAAAAGGLVVWDGEGPCFCGDAVADPLSGLAGASAVLAALRQGGAWKVDVSMADLAAACAAGPPPASAPRGNGVDGATGRGRTGPEVVSWPGSQPSGLPPARGADTEAVLAELGIG
jgi:hypothetical protein